MKQKGTIALKMELIIFQIQWTPTGKSYSFTRQERKSEHLIVILFLC